MKDRLIPKSQVIEILGCTRKYFEGLISKGELPMIKISTNKRYVRESHLNQWLNNKTINLPLSEDVEVIQKDDFIWKPIFGGKK